MAEEYPYIRAYAQHTGMKSKLLYASLDHARRTNAPSDVVFRDARGRWVRLSEVEDEGWVDTIRRAAGGD